MTDEEILIEQQALAFVKSHQKELVAQFAPSDMCHSVDNPVSLFMAGSPGAGKTEISKSLIKRFRDMPVRIDADEIRSFCPGYTGANAHLFQAAATKGVNILYDHVRHTNCNCILDGTFAYAGAEENITRSLDRKRLVEIWFVYQDPVTAWEFTKARESLEARHVSKDVFIKAFIASRHNTVAAKKRFGDQIELNLLVKNYKDGKQELFLNISAAELDQRTNGSYSEDELNRILI